MAEIDTQRMLTAAELSPLTLPWAQGISLNTNGPLDLPVPAGLSATSQCWEWEQEHPGLVFRKLLPLRPLLNLDPHALSPRPASHPHWVDHVRVQTGSNTK